MITRVIQRKRPRRPVFLFMGGATVAALLISAVALGLVNDTGSYNVEVESKDFSSGLVLLDGDAASGSVEYIGSSADNQSSGTGTFDPFLRLQGDPTQRGYNTDGPVAFETKSGKWTKAILASAIPIVNCVIDDDPVTTGQCWEIFVDINENNTAKYVSLNEVEVWFTTNPNLVGYVDPTGFPSGATPVYDFSGEILIHDVNQGSGRGDLRYLIPVDNSFTSLTYFVLYSKWGTTTTTAPDGKTYGSDGGFEEWKVRKAPNLSILKTANPVGPVNAGTAIGFDITISNTGAATATNVTITDPLPAGGGGLNWSLDPAFTGCLISGAAGSQTLNCSFTSLAAGASIGPIHITSPTTAADCQVVSNTATVASDAGPGGSSTASVTVQCGALQITKSAKHADTSGDTSANLVATFDITDSAGNLFQVTTDATGVGCVGGMAVGLTQSIVESSVPTGYAAPTIANVTVASGACAAVGVTNVNVENSPLTDVQISIDSQHDGATSTLIECWGPGSDPATDPADYSATVSDGSLSIPDLDPTDPAITLNCQITVDP